jgi:hypothetical protein
MRLGPEFIRKKVFATEDNTLQTRQMVQSQNGAWEHVQNGAKKEWVWRFQQSSAISTACMQIWQILAGDCSLKQ